MSAAGSAHVNVHVADAVGEHPRRQAKSVAGLDATSSHARHGDSVVALLALVFGNDDSVLEEDARVVDVIGGAVAVVKRHDLVDGPPAHFLVRLRGAHSGGNRAVSTARNKR